MAVQPPPIGSLSSPAAQGLIDALYPPQPEFQTEFIRESKDELEGLITDLSGLLRETVQKRIPLRRMQENIEAVLGGVRLGTALEIREIWGRAKQIIEQRALKFLNQLTRHINGDGDVIGRACGVRGFLGVPLPLDRFGQFRDEIANFEDRITNHHIPFIARSFAEGYLQKVIVWNVHQLTHEIWEERLGRYPAGILPPRYNRYLIATFMIYVQRYLANPILFFQEQQRRGQPQ